MPILVQVDFPYQGERDGGHAAAGGWGVLPLSCCSLALLLLSCSHSRRSRLRAVVVLLCCSGQAALRSCLLALLPRRPCTRRPASPAAPPLQGPLGRPWCRP